MATHYQYQGQHYELPDGLSNDEAMTKIRRHLIGQMGEENANRLAGPEARQHQAQARKEGLERASPFTSMRTNPGDPPMNMSEGAQEVNARVAPLALAAGAITAPLATQGLVAGGAALAKGTVLGTAGQVAGYYGGKGTGAVAEEVFGLPEGTQEWFSRAGQFVGGIYGILKGKDAILAMARNAPGKLGLMARSLSAVEAAVPAARTATAQSTLARVAQRTPTPRPAPVIPPKAPTAKQVADEVVKRIEPTKARTLDPLKGVDFNKAGGKKAQMAAVEAKAQYEGRGFVPGVGERPQGSFEPIKGAVKKVTKAASPGAVRAAEHKQLVAFAKQEAKGYKAGEKVWMELDKAGQPVRVMTPGQASAVPENLKTWVKKAWSD